MNLNNWKQALVLMIVLMLAFQLAAVINPVPVKAASEQGILLTDRLNNLELAVFGQLQTTVPAVANLLISLTASNYPTPALINTTTITNAQFLALNTTPISIIAPVTGADIIVGEVVIFAKNLLTTVNAGSGGAITLDYTGGTVNALGTNTLAAATISGQAASTTTAYKIGGGTNVTVTPDVGVSITQPTANFTSGSMSLTVVAKYNYYIHP